MKKIVTKDDPVLRVFAKSVSIEEIKTEKIKKVIRDMSEALSSQEDGVAIAAPQIGESLRIFVISKKIFEYLHTHNKKDKKFDDQIFINPEIIKSSKEKKIFEEGCLSMRYLYGKMIRSAKITIMAYNEKGEKIERGGSGLLAQIFQHETDHLNGILFTDTAKDVVDMPPEKIEEEFKRKKIPKKIHEKETL